MLAQNSRLLILAAPSKWPNPASRLLRLADARLAQDWQDRFGHRVLAVETFVDPDQLKDALVGWMEKEDPTALTVIHRDGKVIKNVQPAPARPHAD